MRKSKGLVRDFDPIKIIHSVEYIYKHALSHARDVVFAILATQQKNLHSTADVAKEVF